MNVSRAALGRLGRTALIKRSEIGGVRRLNVHEYVSEAEGVLMLVDVINKAIDCLRLLLYFTNCSILLPFLRLTMFAAP